MNSDIIDCENKLILHFNKQFIERKNSLPEINKLINLSKNIKKKLKLFPNAKKIIEPKIIKIPSSKKVQSVVLPKINAFTRYKIKKEEVERIVFLGEDSSHYFSFNKPLIYLNENGNDVMRPYQSLKPGDALYMAKSR